MWSSDARRIEVGNVGDHERALLRIFADIEIKQEYEIWRPTYLHDNSPFGFSCPDIIQSERAIGAYTGKHGGFCEIEADSGNCFNRCRKGKIRYWCAPVSTAISEVTNEKTRIVTWFHPRPGLSWKR